MNSNRKQLHSTQAGNAALEAMLILPTILIILALLINMGYNGARYRKAQAATRLSAFAYIDGMAQTDKTKALQQAQGLVSSKLFKGENKPVTLGASDIPGSPQDLPANDGILGRASYRQSVGATVTRSPPYDILPSTPINLNLTLAANTFTFCEMKDDDFEGTATGAFKSLEFIGNVGLWLFGGCGGKPTGFKCGDRCQ